MYSTVIRQCARTPRPVGTRLRCATINFWPQTGSMGPNRKRQGPKIECRVLKMVFAGSAMSSRHTFQSDRPKDWGSSAVLGTRQASSRALASERKTAIKDLIYPRRRSVVRLSRYKTYFFSATVRYRMSLGLAFTKSLSVVPTTCAVHSPKTGPLPLMLGTKTPERQRCAHVWRMCGAPHTSGPTTSQTVTLSYKIQYNGAPTGQTN